MRLAVLSDIHGNLEALKQVLADMKGLRIDQRICLGDMVGYGPDPEAVVRLIRRLKPSSWPISSISFTNQAVICSNAL